MLATDTAAPRTEQELHPTASKILDIILAKAVDGEPTMEDDLAEFTLADIKTHFPAARAAANKQIVRQVDDDRGFETRTQLLTRASLLLLGKMPHDAAMHDTLRAHGLSNNEIADLWPDLIATVADAFQRKHPLPYGQVN